MANCVSRTWFVWDRNEGKATYQVAAKLQNVMTEINGVSPPALKRPNFLIVIC